MITLALDASTYQGTIAVLDGLRLLAERSAAMRGRDSELLMPALDGTLRDARCDLAQVERVVCGAGPGSFTSLRIAASLAKGIAAGRKIPVFAVSSLALIVAGNVDPESPGTSRFLAALDALRGESYVAEFELDGGTVRQIGDMRRIATDAIASTAQDARPVGPDLPGNWLPKARGAALLLDEIRDAGPVNLAAWEPVYGRMAEAQAKWEASHGRSLQH